LAQPAKEIEVTDDDVILPTAIGRRREWTRACLSFSLLAIFVIIIAYGCYEISHILDEANGNMQDKMDKIYIIRDWLEVVLGPTLTLLGTSVAFYMERTR
jgi:hypothetical protein